MLNIGYSAGFSVDPKYEMQGAGEDPAYASAKSKSDKDISSLLSTVSETAIQFYFFVSVTDVLMEDGRGRMVVDLDYTAREGACGDLFYISNEGVSLVENAAHLGLPIPEKLKAVLEQLHDRAEKEDDQQCCTPPE